MPHSVGPTAPGCESGAAGSCRMWPHSFQRQRIRRRRIGARISQAQQSSTSVDHSRATESPFAAARRDVHPWNVRYCPQDAGVRPVRTASPCVAPAAGLVSHIRQRRNSSGTDDSGLADGTRSPGGLLHRPQREITGERVGITCMARARPEVFPGQPPEHPVQPRASHLSASTSPEHHKAPVAAEGWEGRGRHGTTPKAEEAFRRALPLQWPWHCARGSTVGWGVPQRATPVQEWGCTLHRGASAVQPPGPRICSYAPCPLLVRRAACAGPPSDCTSRAGNPDCPQAATVMGPVYDTPISRPWPDSAR